MLQKSETSGYFILSYGNTKIIFFRNHFEVALKILFHCELEVWALLSQKVNIFLVNVISDTHGVFSLEYHSQTVLKHTEIWDLI